MKALEKDNMLALASNMVAFGDSDSKIQAVTGLTFEEIRGVRKEYEEWKKSRDPDMVKLWNLCMRYGGIATYVALQRAGIHSVSDLQQITPETLRKIDRKYQENIRTMIRDADTKNIENEE